VRGMRFSYLKFRIKSTGNDSANSIEMDSVVLPTRTGKFMARG
jgi:hypothetical protein